jgi:4-oxalocrotonate tautomerase
MSVLNYGAESVSVGFEEVKSQEWAEKVYRPDIKAKWTSSTRNQDTTLEK